MTPESHTFGCLVTKDWNCLIALEGFGDMAFMK